MSGNIPFGGRCFYFIPQSLPTLLVWRQEYAENGRTCNCYTRKNLAFKWRIAVFTFDFVFSPLLYARPSH